MTYDDLIEEAEFWERKAASPYAAPEVQHSWLEKAAAYREQAKQLGRAVGETFDGGKDADR